MPRTWSRTDTNGVKDRKSRDIFIKVDEYLIDVAKQLTALSGSGGGTGGGSSQVITQGASELGTPIVGQPFVMVQTDNTLLSERVLAVTAPVTLADGGAKGNITVAFDSSLMTTVAPAMTFGTANVIGTGAPFAANATIALFDAVAPADHASAAVHGASLKASDSAHVHRFPTSLMEYTNSKKIVLTSTATISTLTSDVATVNLAGMTTLRPGTTNAVNFGAASNRYLSGYFGTTGINCSGPVVLGGNLTTAASTSITLTAGTVINGDMNPISDGLPSIGSPTLRWAGVSSYTLTVADGTDPTYNTGIEMNSSVAMSVDRSLIFDVTNNNRTIKLTGNPTLADWFDQNLKTTGTPQLARIGIGTAADGTELVKLADPANIILGTTTGTKIGTATTQKLGFYNATPVVQRTDMGALTDSTGGTANGTLVDVGVLFNQGNINDNFADCAAKITAIRTALRDLGLMA